MGITDDILLIIAGNQFTGNPHYRDGLTDSLPETPEELLPTPFDLLDIL